MDPLPSHCQRKQWKEAVDSCAGDFEKVVIAEPLLGEVGKDATEINADKETVAKAVVAAAVKDAGFDDAAAAAEDPPAPAAAAPALVYPHCCRTRPTQLIEPASGQLFAKIS